MARDERNNWRDDEPDISEIKRNLRVTEDSTQCTPFNEEILAGDADYGQALYDNFPEDNVGFMPPGNQPGNRRRR